MGSEGLRRRFCDGFEADPLTPGLATNSERVANRELTIATLEAVFADWEAEALLARLTASQGLLIDEHGPAVRDGLGSAVTDRV